MCGSGRRRRLPWRPCAVKKREFSARRPAFVFKPESHGTGTARQRCRGDMSCTMIEAHADARVYLNSLCSFPAFSYVLFSFRASCSPMPSMPPPPQPAPISMPPPLHSPPSSALQSRQTGPCLSHRRCALQAQSQAHQTVLLPMRWTTLRAMEFSHCSTRS